jgi:hypothetical protein
MIAPLSKAAATPAQRLSVAFTTVALSTPVKATTDPTERSKSRDARQNIIVHATIPICETESARPSMFWTVKKYCTDRDSAMKIAKKIRTRLYSSRNAENLCSSESEVGRSTTFASWDGLVFINDFMLFVRPVRPSSRHDAPKNPSEKLPRR